MNHSQRSFGRRSVLSKSAGLATDYLATIPTSMVSAIPYVGPLANLAGTGGYIGGLVSDPEGDGNPATSALSVVPGVGQFRLGQRSRRVMDASNAAGASGTANLVAEHLGGLTSPLLSAAAGGLLGSGIGAAIGGRRGARRGAGRGALAGAAVGLTAPLVAGIAAAIRRKRSKQEQIDSDTTGRAVAKYLVPGLAAYDNAKRLGTSTHYDAKRKGDKGEKKAAEAAYYAGFCKAAEAAGVDPVELVKQAALKPGDAFKLVRTALEGRRSSELGGKVLATHNFLSGTGRLSRGTADNLAHMLRLDEAIKGVTRAGYMPHGGRVTLPGLVRAAHLDLPAHVRLSGEVTSTPRSEAVRALLREMGYGK